MRHSDSLKPNALSQSRPICLKASSNRPCLSVFANSVLMRRLHRVLSSMIAKNDERQCSAHEVARNAIISLQNLQV